MNGSPIYLIWLEWPEKCFRVQPDDLRYFRSLVGEASRIVRVRSEAAFLKALPTATHVITWHFRREWFALAPALRLVATPAAGRELVSTHPPKGVCVHFGGFHGEIISESALGFMLAWARGFYVVNKAPTGWPRTWISDKCYTLSGTRAIVAGYGRIGRAIGEKLAAFGVEVIGVTRHGLKSPNLSRAALKTLSPDGSLTRTLLKTVDWFVMALPSTTGSDDFLNARVISNLPRRCVVVNVGRGNSVDERALVAALSSGRLAGAYLDVCKTEPTAVGRAACGQAIDPLNPNVPNLVLMPHACAFAPQYVKMCFKELKDEGLI